MGSRGDAADWPFELRFGGPTDAAPLTSLHLQCLRETYLPLYGQAFVDALTSERSQAEIAEEDLAFLSDPDRRVVLASGPDGALVGFASVCVGPQEWERQFVPDLAPELELVKLYTLASTHGSGLGAELLSAAVGSTGPAYLWIMSGNARAEAFYRKHGFRELGQRYAAEGPWAGQTTHRLRRP